MKKIATLFFLFILLFCVSNKETSISVFNEKSSEELNRFSYFEIDTPGISTINFTKIFSEYQVISIKPYIYPLYELKIKKEIGEYVFSENTIENNIYEFTKKYILELEKNGFNKDVSFVYIKGIPIQKVRIFCTQNDLKKLKMPPLVKR